jgi:hypothetical protein
VRALADRWQNGHQIAHESPDLLVADLVAFVGGLGS